MEVYLPNLPPDLSEKGLYNSLLSSMERLRVRDWKCTKPKSKDHGWLTFLHKAEGEEFLRQYQVNRSEAPKLRVLNVGIYPGPSKNPPKEWALKTLRQKSGKQSSSTSTATPSRVASFTISGLACGYNWFEPTGPDTTLTFVEQSRCSQSGTASFGLRTLKIFLGKDEVEIPFYTIVAMITGLRSTATLVLAEPPRFYSSSPELFGDDLGEAGSGFTKPNKARTTRIWGDPQHAKYTGHCLVYRIEFRMDAPLFVAAINQLKARLKDTFEIIDAEVPSKQPAPDMDFPTALDSFESFIKSLSTASRLPFGMMFQTQALVWNHYLHPATATRILLRLSNALDEARKAGRPPPYSERAMKHLLDTIPFPVPNADPTLTTADGLMAKLRELEKTRSVPLADTETSSKAWIYRASVTPTHILLHGPDLETKNRILRKFPQNTNHFLRVQFCEENGEDLRFTPRIANERIMSRFKAIFEKGIQIAGRVYGFLGFSHSSLRSHSAWFSSSFFDPQQRAFNTYFTIIRDLGEFNQIRVPARCAARIGQAFSETPFHVPLAEHGISWSYIDDIKSPDGERVFSDGIGTVSLGAAQQIWTRLPADRRPTCFQIRWGGVKGMLSLDTRLPGAQFCIRKESMEKFKSEDISDLEICDFASRPLRMVLNRQIIKILEDMGTSESWFLSLQEAELQRLQNVTSTTYNTATFLRILNIGSSFELPKFINRLEHYGLDYRQDDFLRSAIETVVLQELRLLKHRARIPVPKGVTLFGILDETAYLAPDEVFVTFDSSRQDTRGMFDGSIKDGPVLVTRSPCLHPGDIKLLYQKTPPKGHRLHALKNCIIFSQKGDRDIPSQLSGGDLDGDLYHIIWDPKAIPQRTFSPADYPRVVAQPLPREVSKTDMAEFFVDFMKTDQLGIICTRHVILADRMPQGTADPSCVKLAELASCAVDFSKTGIPVDISKMPPLKGRSRPDFMAPSPPTKIYDRGQIEFLDEEESPEQDDDLPKYPYYRSEKVLGVLYRGIDETKIWQNCKHLSEKGSSRYFWAMLEETALDKIYDCGLHRTISCHKQLRWACELRNVFETELDEARYRYSTSYLHPLTEQEAFCGIIHNKSGILSRQQRNNSAKLQESVDRFVGILVKALSPQSGHGLQPTLFQVIDAIELCFACVIAGGYPRPTGDYFGDGTLKSFRIVAAARLLKELDRYVFLRDEAERKYSDEE